MQVHAQVAAEKLAWQLSEQYGISLVVINPGMILGSVMSRRTDVPSMEALRVRFSLQCSI